MSTSNTTGRSDYPLVFGPDLEMSEALARNWFGQER